MNNTQQPRNWLSRMRLPSARAALALAAVLASAVITTPVAQAQTLNVLHSFNGTDGTGPSQAPLVQATDGNLYGTTGGGGADDFGTVFKITPSGTLTTLYSFCSQTRLHGRREPYAGLVQATNGNFYGTTSGGGASITAVWRRLWSSSKSRPGHADDALQLLLAQTVHGRRAPLCGAGPGHRWEPLRDNARRRGQRRMARSSKSPRAAR